MARSGYYPTLDLPHERGPVGEELATVLHNLLALALIDKQLHWMAVGPESRSLHLQLDDLVDSWSLLSDTVGERAVALGHVVDGQAPAVVAGSELAPVARRRSRTM